MDGRDPRDPVIARQATGPSPAASGSAPETSEEVYRLLMEQSPVGIVVTDVRGQITKANPTALAILGSPSEEATRRFNVLTMPNLQQVGVSDAYRRVISNNEPERLQVSYTSAWGKSSDVSLQIVPLRDDAAAVVGTLSMIEDVTASRRAYAEKMALLEMAHDLSGTVGLDEVLDRVHERAARLLPCDRVGTYYLEPSSHVYRVARRYGVPPELESAVERFEVALDFPDHGSGVIVVSDVEHQNVVPAEIVRQFGLGAIVIAPLFVRGRQRGVLVAVRLAPAKEFEATDVQLFEGIARQVSIALERADLDRAQQEEAAISAALARVGKELMASFNSPTLTERLCRLTADVLESDCSYTFLLRDEDGEFVPAAQAGDGASEWEARRSLRLPVGVGAIFDASDVVQVAASPPPALAEVQRQLGLAGGVYMALRRGGNVCGLHVAGYRGSAPAFDRLQERIAGGLAQLASFALENARLLIELESASRLKSDFVATMSHELRTPLNAIIGYCDLLLDGAYGKLGTEQAIAVKRLQGRSHELFELITATLDVSRLEAGQLPLELESTNLNDLLEDIRGESYRFRLQPGVGLRWQTQERLPIVRTDAVKVKVILKNLLSNAAKFTERGSITVAASAEPESVVLSVSDTGIGMRLEERRHIFEAFRQADSSNTRRYGGVGLGLYIVRRLLELLGGTIEVESELGRGTTFSVRLPR